MRQFSPSSFLMLHFRLILFGNVDSRHIAWHLHTSVWFDCWTHNTIEVKNRFVRYPDERHSWLTRIYHVAAPSFNVSSYITAVNLHAGVLESTEIWIPTPPLRVEKGIILTSYLPEGENEGIFNEVLKLVDAILA